MSLARRSGLLANDTAIRSSVQRQQLEAQLEAALDKVRARVAVDIVSRAVRQAEVESKSADGVEDIRAGVIVILDRGERAPLLEHVVKRLIRYYTSLRETQNDSPHYLFAVAAGPLYKPIWPLVLISSSARLLAHSETYISLRFPNRITSLQISQEDTRYYRRTIVVSDRGSATHDELLLWDVVRKATRFSRVTRSPPPGSLSASSLLSMARMRLERLTPEQAFSELQSPDLPIPAVLIDIRTDSERQAEGCAAGAVRIERGELEWKLDPRSDEGERHVLAGRFDLRVIVMDGGGRASSFAAVALHDLGLLNATDVIGGFAAWKRAGLPTSMHI